MMMKSYNDETVNRYLRLVLHSHPMRSREYLRTLLTRGMSTTSVMDDVLLPAREHLLKMRTAHQVNATDVKMALAVIRKASDSLFPVHTSIGYPLGVRDLTTGMPHPTVAATERLTEVVPN